MTVCPPTRLPIRRAIPADATVAPWSAPDGWPLRRFVWRASGRGTIIFQTGRGDVFEKYLETFAHWHARGWTIVAADWRGQGGSGRLSDNPRVGHADDFAVLVRDLAALTAEEAAAAQAGPIVVMGHSMGGHLVLQAALDAAIRPAALVLVAPMLGLRAPVGARLGEVIARVMRASGDPARAAWKGHERPGGRLDRQTLLTGDATRYADEQWWYAKAPETKLGPPSWGWLATAFAATRVQRGDARLAALDVPVLALIATADALVDARAAQAVVARLPDATTITFGRESAHEILREADPVRDRALAAIDAFLDERAA